MFKVIQLGVATLLGFLLVACANGISESPAGYLDSEVVSSTIKTKLDTEIGTNGIQVRTYHDVVQLSGRVPSFAIKKRAGDIAASVGDIKHIRNDLVIGNGHV